MAILISFDIDGTLEVGDPPGVLTLEMVRLVKEKGFLIGSCSDRTLSGQRALWKLHNIPMDFVAAKPMLRSCLIRSEPMLLVITRMVFLKSTRRPLASVR